jgi:hypothetical protein
LKNVVNLHNHGERKSITDVHTAEEKLEKLMEFLDADPCSFCETCEAMKCYGSLYPICEPVLDMLKEMLAH